MIRSVIPVGACSRRKRSSGNSGVSLSNSGRRRAVSASTPLTESIRSSAKYFSLSRGWRMGPSTWSPLRSANRRTWLSET